MDPVVFLAIAYGAVFGGLGLYLRSLISKNGALEKKIEQRSVETDRSKGIGGP